MLTPYRVYETMLAHPYPGLAGLTRDGDDCVFVLDGAPWRYDGAQWTVGDRVIPAEWPKFGNLDDADKVHWQIRSVLAELAKPSDRTNAETVDAPLVIGGGATVDILRTAIESIAEHVGAEPWALDEVTDKVASMQDRLTAEIDRRKDVEAQLAKMTDAHAVVSQRLVGAQREVAERDATIDELRARVKGSCTTKDGQDPLDPLLSRHNAPVKIGGRTLSPAERAAFVIRRLTRAAQNARAEAAALRAEQEEIADALGDAPAYAEHADGSLVGLNLVERIRARLT